MSLIRREKIKMKIVLYGHPTLREKAEKVDEVDDNVREILDEMVALMRKANGVDLQQIKWISLKDFLCLSMTGF